MKTATLKVENGDVVGALRALLRQMLQSGLVDAVLVPRKLPSGDGYVQSLVKEPDRLDEANALAPTMAVQSASILSDLTATEGGGRVAAVLKPCELRGTVELVKFLQAGLDNVITIAVDCAGTYEVESFGELDEQERASAAQSMSSPGNAEGKRVSCQICAHPAAEGADINVCLFGSDASSGVTLQVGERFESDLRDKLSLELVDGEPSGRGDAVRKAADARAAGREKMLAEFKGKTDSLEKLLAEFSTCIRCHNCMNVCPICYCKQCVFHSSVFEHRSDQYLRWADRKGALRMPSDTLMFHLTRLSHMASSCVACGMCESACPNGLPVSTLFTMIGGKIQDMFGYVPGRSVEEEPPVSVFKEDELQTETGSGERH